MSIVHRDPVDKVQVLDDDGHVLDSADVPDISDEDLLGIYSHMRLARHLDERAVSLQRQGRMGTYPPLSGQEGAQIGSVYALADDDWLVPSYREHGANIVRGVEPERILLYWMGDERGNTMGDANVFTVSVPIATHIPHATGMAWASKMKDEDRVFLCYFGDGATSEGDFHEGMNFAGVFDTPTVFFCNNNQWAISVPRQRQTASQTIAQKAQAYGFEGVLVDGMDPLAVYKVTERAVEKARNPDEGEPRPTLIEAVQYRFGAHTTADDPSKYRSEEEVEKWRNKDPIPRMRTFLKETGRLDDAKDDEITERIEEMVDEAIQKAESYEPPEPDAMFENVYEEMTWRQREGKEYLDGLRDEYDIGGETT